MLNGTGFTYDKPSNLWVVRVADGSAKRITGGKAFDEGPTWSPDGKRIAFVSRRHPDADLTWRYDIYLVDADGGAVTQVTGGPRRSHLRAAGLEPGRPLDRRGRASLPRWQRVAQ